MMHPAPKPAPAFINRQREIVVINSLLLDENDNFLTDERNNKLINVGGLVDYLTDQLNRVLTDEDNNKILS